jgi:hypothetical protein
VSERDAINEKAVEAAAQWARTNFWAPRDFKALIKKVEETDEAIERVVANVVRRTLKPAFGWTGERRTRPPRVNHATIDPFAHALDTLRSDTECVAECDECAASGATKCGRCRGSGTATCSNCAGYGKFRNPSTNRMNQCKACKKTGTVQCGLCAGDGRVSCPTCSGSGHKLCWLLFEDSSRCELSVTSSPAIAAHPYLAESRLLDPTELRAFSTESFETSNGAIGRDQLPTHRTIVDAQLAKIDQRTERVIQQQYVRVAAVRRDVVFEMSGTVGVLVLSGNALTPARTPEALRPIRRRLWLSISAMLLLVIGLTGVVLALSGSSSYFDKAKGIGASAFLAAIAFFMPWFFGLLRSWGSAGNRTTTVEKVAGVFSLGAIAAGVAILLLSQPAVADADSALARNDVARARVVLEALRETEGAAHDVLDLEDRILLSEASSHTGDKKLGLLDQVAARKGSKAAEAASTARAERLKSIRGAIAQKQPMQALAAIDKWFPKTSDPEVAEEIARAHEASARACSSLSCKYSFATRAQSAHPNEVRATTAATLRSQLETALAPPATIDKDVLVHLRTAHDLEVVALETLKLVADDDLKKRAQTALDWILSERAKVPVLGANIDVVEQLVGQLKRLDTERASTSLTGGLDAFFAFDSKARCTGIYVVGTSEHQRMFVSSEWSAQRLIAQAIGRPVQTRITAPSSGVMRWYEGSASVTARFLDKNLVELRIGKAAP